MPSQAGGFLDIVNSHSLGEMAFKAGTKGLFNLGRLGLSKAIKSDFAKKKIKRMTGKYLDQMLDSVTGDLSKKLDPLHKGRGIDIQKHLAKLGELHMRTPAGKKYNYCGPGTKLEERLASNDPKYRDPINNLDAICQKHDISYSQAKSLKDKHIADQVMLDEISKIPYWKRPWGTSIAQAAIKGKKTFGLGVKKSKNGKSRRVKKKTGKKN